MQKNFGKKVLFSYILAFELVARILVISIQCVKECI